VIYGSSIGARWRGASQKVRVPAAAFLIDPTFFVGTNGYREGRGHAYYFGGVLILALAWLAAITIGFTAGTGIPPALQLEYCVTFFLLAELVRDARTRPGFAAAGVSALIAIVGNGLPLGGGLLAGMIVGMVVAVRLDGSLRQEVE
jgi:predicted branched-subunit amino acid permease